MEQMYIISETKTDEIRSGKMIVEFGRSSRVMWKMIISTTSQKSNKGVR